MLSLSYVMYVSSWSQQIYTVYMDDLSAVVVASGVFALGGGES